MEKDNLVKMEDQKATKQKAENTVEQKQGPMRLDIDMIQQNRLMIAVEQEANELQLNKLKLWHQKLETLNSLLDKKGSSMAEEMREQIYAKCNKLVNMIVGLKV